MTTDLLWLRDNRNLFLMALEAGGLRPGASLDARGPSSDLQMPCVCPKGGRGGGRMDWKFGISGYKLLYGEWINSKVLLYSTGNYVQYSVIKHNGKEHGKEYVCA